VTDFLKPNRALQALLEGPALATTSAPARAIAHTITEVSSFGTGVSEIKLQRVKEVDASGVLISLEPWVGTNTPKLGAVANAAQAGASKATLEGESTLVITSLNNELRFGAQVADLRVILLVPVSRTAGGSVHPSKTVPYEAAITGLQNENEITVKVSFASLEGYRVPGKGIAKLTVTNLKQLTQSKAFDVEIV
jgi:hypothetical protein